MTQNLIDIELSDEALAEIGEALDRLETHLVLLRGLEPELRRSLPKMGDKSEAFCRQALAAFAQNHEILPRNFDLAGYQRDLANFDLIRPLRQRLARLLERLSDTEMALGSDLMTASLEGYAVLKVSGKGEGLDHLRQALSARFARRRRGAVDTEDAEPEAAQ